MSRAVTFVALALTAGVSYGLYQLSYEVQRLDDRLAGMNRQLAQERENIEVLNAEWSYMTRPDVLQERVERYLPEFATVKARQIIPLADLPLKGAAAAALAAQAPKAGGPRQPPKPTARPVGPVTKPVVKPAMVQP
ncbi:MAG: cell division protein FtsL [Ferrovibrionaceae bacterium]